MSYAFITALLGDEDDPDDNGDPDQSFQDLLENIHHTLQRRGYAQKPLLSCCHPLGAWSALLFCGVCGTEC